jgi:hypothetical protein
VRVDDIYNWIEKKEFDQQANIDHVDGFSKTLLVLDESRNDQ